MAGTISLSLSQQFDALGNVLAEGRLYFYRAGTVSTPQNAFYDTALTLPLPNPYVLDAAGRIPQFFLADGSIKVVLIDKHGTTQIDADNLLVIGPSGGGGGGGSVDPTTVLQTGWMQLIYASGVISGFVRANGRTIGSATSGATERANADTQALFLFLYAQDTNLAVSGGRGVSAAADWAANKTIALPDIRGRLPVGPDGMGNSLAGRLTATYSTASGDVLGTTFGAESKALLTANLPPYTPAGTVSVTSTSTHVVQDTGGIGSSGAGGGVHGQFNDVSAVTESAIASTGSVTGTPQGGTSTPVAIAMNAMIVTFYLKL